MVPSQTSLLPCRIGGVDAVLVPWFRFQKAVGGNQNGAGEEPKFHLLQLPWAAKIAHEMRVLLHLQCTQGTRHTVTSGDSPHNGSEAMHASTREPSTDGVNHAQQSSRNATLCVPREVGSSDLWVAVFYRADLLLSAFPPLGSRARAAAPRECTR